MVVNLHFQVVWVTNAGSGFGSALAVFSLSFFRKSIIEIHRSPAMVTKNNQNYKSGSWLLL